MGKEKDKEGKDDNDEKKGKEPKKMTMDMLIHAMESERNRRMLLDQQRNEGKPTITNEKVNKKTLEMFTDPELLSAIKENAKPDRGDAYFVVAIYRMEKRHIKDIACFDFPEGSHQKLKSFFTLEPPSSPRKIPARLSKQVTSGHGGRWKGIMEKKMKVQSDRHSSGLRLGQVMKMAQHKKSITANVKQCSADFCEIERYPGSSYCTIHLAMKKHSQGENHQSKEVQKHLEHELKPALKKLECGDSREEAEAFGIIQSVADQVVSSNYFDKNIEAISRAIAGTLNHVYLRPSFLRIPALECLQTLFSKHAKKMSNYVQSVVPSLIQQMAHTQKTIDNDGEAPPTINLRRRSSSKPSANSHSRPSVGRHNTKARPPVHRAGTSGSRKKSTKATRKHRSYSVSHGQTAIQISKSIQLTKSSSTANSNKSKPSNHRSRGSVGSVSHHKKSSIKNKKDHPAPKMRRASVGAAPNLLNKRHSALVPGGHKKSRERSRSHSNSRDSSESGAHRNSADVVIVETMEDLERLMECLKATWHCMLSFMAVGKIIIYVCQFVQNPNRQPGPLYQGAQNLLGCIETLGRSAVNDYCVDKICQAIEFCYKQHNQDDGPFSDLADKCVDSMVTSSYLEENNRGEPLMLDLLAAFKKNFDGAHESRAENTIKKVCGIKGGVTQDNIKRSHKGKTKKKKEKKKENAPGDGKQPSLESSLSKWSELLGDSSFSEVPEGAETEQAQPRKKHSVRTKKKNSLVQSGS